LQKLFKVIGLKEFLPQDGALNPISIAACKGGVFTNSLCVAFIFSIVGKSTQLDRVRTQFRSRRAHYMAQLSFLPLSSG
jgi:hypothetical protein